MKRVTRKKRKINSDSNYPIEKDNNSRIEMIQLLIPLGLLAVEEILQQEVSSMTGKKYERNENSLQRWGRNSGSVYMGDQKVRLKIPRVRDMKTKKEVILDNYKKLQSPQRIEDKTMKSILNGLSTRKYEEVAKAVPSAFGIKHSSVSKRFIKASTDALANLLERDLKNEDIRVVFLDGKSFGDMEMVIAVGINSVGKKVILGFIETSTENHRVCKDFIHGLIDRGISLDSDILFVVDGSKGLSKGLRDVFGDGISIQRCHWHKRENVVSYLPKNLQDGFRSKLKTAMDISDYTEAKKALNKIEKELHLINKSAVASLREGQEEILTLQRIGVKDPALVQSIRTTNIVENVNRMLAIYTDRVCRWKNSDQRQRWVGTALLEIEKKLNKIKGHKHLEKLQEKLISYKKTEQQKKAA